MTQAKNPYKNLNYSLEFVVRLDWPWKSGEKFDIKCNHLVKYDGLNMEISGVSFMGFELGEVGIKTELLQTAGHALMLIDASQYHFCELVRGAPDDDNRKKYYQLMMDDRIRAQDFIMGCPYY